MFGNDTLKKIFLFERNTPLTNKSVIINYIYTKFALSFLDVV